jgi:pimeloyl-ACP methyl ester carboxylesterase
MADFLLVPGGWQGGWAFDSVSEQLRAAGHNVLALTLAGLESNPVSTGPTPNLDAHVEQVLTSLDEFEDVVLAGHSYAGLVIASAADRLPGRIAHLVFIDAYVPADGDSCWSLTTPAFRDMFVAGAAADGRTVAPPAGMDPRARPHPLPAYLQAVRLADPTYQRVSARTLIHSAGWSGTPFTEQYQRLLADPAWTVHTLDCGHNAMRERPDELTALLSNCAPTN